MQSYSKFLAILLFIMVSTLLVIMVSSKPGKNGNSLLSFGTNLPWPCDSGDCNDTGTWDSYVESQHIDNCALTTITPGGTAWNIVCTSTGCPQWTGGNVTMGVYNLTLACQEMIVGPTGGSAQLPLPTYSQAITVGQAIALGFAMGNGISDMASGGWDSQTSPRCCNCSQFTDLLNGPVAWGPVNYLQGPLDKGCKACMPTTDPGWSSAFGDYGLSNPRSTLGSWGYQDTVTNTNLTLDALPGVRQFQCNLSQSGILSPPGKNEKIGKCHDHHCSGHCDYQDTTKGINDCILCGNDCPRPMVRFYRVGFGPTGDSGGLPGQDYPYPPYFVKYQPAMYNLVITSYRGHRRNDPLKPTASCPAQNTGWDTMLLKNVVFCPCPYVVRMTSPFNVGDWDAAVKNYSPAGNTTGGYHFDNAYVWSAWCQFDGRADFPGQGKGWGDRNQQIMVIMSADQSTQPGMIIKWKINGAGWDGNKCTKSGTQLGPECTKRYNQSWSQPCARYKAHCEAAPGWQAQCHWEALSHDTYDDSCDCKWQSSNMVNAFATTGIQVAW